jgi:hypothetical protein
MIGRFTPDDLERFAALSDELRAALLPDGEALSPADRLEALNERLYGFVESAATVTEDAARAAGVDYLEAAHAAFVGTFTEAVPVTKSWEPEDTARFLEECADLVEMEREETAAFSMDDRIDVDVSVHRMLNRGKTPAAIAKALGVDVGEVTKLAAGAEAGVKQAYEAGQRAAKAEAAAKARRRRGRTLGKVEKKITAALEEADFAQVPADKLAALLIKITEAQRAEAADDAVVVPL